MLAREHLLPPSEVRRMFSYDPATGELTWAVRHQKIKVGAKVGYLLPQGHIRASINCTMHYVHRVVWCWMTGAWPAAQIDHIDGDRANNRWGNLREATQSENLYNAKLHARNTSGRKGVSWAKRERLWLAYINVGGKRVGLGYHKTFALACAARERGEAELHGEFARCT